MTQPVLSPGSAGTAGVGNAHDGSRATSGHPLSCEATEAATATHPELVPAQIPAAGGLHAGREPGVHVRASRRWWPRWRRTVRWRPWCGPRSLRPCSQPANQEMTCVGRAPVALGAGPPGGSTWPDPNTVSNFDQRADTGPASRGHDPRPIRCRRAISAWLAAAMSSFSQARAMRTLPPLATVPSTIHFRRVRCQEVGGEYRLPPHRLLFVDRGGRGPGQANADPPTRCCRATARLAKSPYLDASTSGSMRVGVARPSPAPRLGRPRAATDQSAPSARRVLSRRTGERSSRSARTGPREHGRQRHQ